ncbi:DoxX family protein [Paracidobacterium acidisoli]|uniref:DoxX family protein n=1 Tax=Paracidobacterium acidisoli TaxID=2303751 RepID=A0A372IU49_9BACT|nr:DoxX family protein [Paracidobacterium acidisoli]MBT9329912.1 DoxX family protein [Paracidobacterium acidisoli]
MGSSSSSTAASDRSGFAGKISCWYCSFLSATAKLRSPFLLFVRLYWGWQFIQTGIGHLGHLTRVTSFFASLGLPFPHFTAAFVGTIELAGGILLVLGLLTRVTGLVLTVNMVMAYLTADRDALLSFLSDPGKFYEADPFTFLFAALIVLIFGAGFFSLDYWLAHRSRN